MALSSNSVWEVRPTVGNDTNGGGFVTGASGTDFSQLNSKNTTGSNISTTDGVGNGTTTWTSATGNFSTAIVGNIIYLSGSGITTGWYQVTARASTTSITLDRSPGTGTGATMNIGGALATIIQANTNAVISNTIYVKASGTYTVTAAMTVTLVSVGGSSPTDAPLAFIGYTTTRGDNGIVTWTTSTNSIDLVDFTAASNVSFANFKFSSTAGTPGDGLQAKTTGSTSYVTLTNCEITGMLVGIEGNFAVNWAFIGLTLVNCNIHGNSIGVRNSGPTLFFGSYVHNNTNQGFIMSQGTPGASAAWALLYSGFYDNGSDGVDGATGGDTSASLIIDACFFSTNGGAGVVVPNAVTFALMSITNSIFDANAAYGIDGAAGTNIVTINGYNNAFYNNGTAATRNIAGLVASQTLTGSPYNSIPTDFTLNSTAGAGAACKAAAFQSSVIP